MLQIATVVGCMQASWYKASSIFFQTDYETLKLWILKKPFLYMSFAFIQYTDELIILLHRNFVFSFRAFNLW